MDNPDEIEMFRLTPQVDSHYEHAILTRKEGNYPDTKYYTVNTPRFVGKFIKQISYGYGDGKQVMDYFDDNGKENIVYYTYEGTTSYREVN
jgi:hypothetical protein